MRAEKANGFTAQYHLSAPGLRGGVHLQSAMQSHGRNSSRDGGAMSKLRETEADLVTANELLKGEREANRKAQAELATQKVQRRLHVQMLESTTGELDALRQAATPVSPL